MIRLYPLAAIVTAALIAPAGVFAGTVTPQRLAENVAVPEAQGQADSNVPRRGMSMEQVKRSWGAPAQRVGAVGEPPISRWIYDGFTVYFERSAVIHTVQHVSSTGSA